MKTKKKKYRNPAATSANSRNSGGPMKNKKDKRVNGKNKKKEYLDENY